MEEKKICISGSGGQGVLLFGRILATAAMLDGKNVTFIPSYGAEMRGGLVNCMVIISGREIGSPIVKKPDILIAMNDQSVKKYASTIASGGLLVANRSLVASRIIHHNLEILFLPAMEIAKASSGQSMLANMVLLGALGQKTKLVPVEKIKESIYSVISPQDKNLIALNLKALTCGIEYIREGSLE